MLVVVLALQALPSSASAFTRRTIHASTYTNPKADGHTAETITLPPVNTTITIEPSQGESQCGSGGCTSEQCVPSPFPAALNELMTDLAATAALQAAIERIEGELAGHSPTGDVLTARRRDTLARTTREALTVELSRLRGEQSAAQSRIAAIPDLGASAARASVFAHTAGSEIPSAEVIKGFAEAAKQAAKSKLEADKEAGKLTEKEFKEKQEKADKLIDQLETLGRLSSGETISAAEQQQIVEQAVVGLVGEFAGKDSEELAGKMKTLIAALRGTLTDKEKKKILEKEIPNLVEKLVKAAGGEKGLGKSVKELTQQIQTLVKLTVGEPLSDEEKAAIFDQAVLGLLEKTVFNGYLNPLFLKAAIAGYDFAKPFGDAIARGLQTVAAREIFTAASGQIEHKDSSYQQTIAQDHTVVIQTTIEGSGPYVGWIVTAYWDPTAMKVVLKVVPGQDKALLASTRAAIRTLLSVLIGPVKDAEWIFDPASCEPGSVLSVSAK